jgi:hypothetical protein
MLQGFDDDSDSGNWTNEAVYDNKESEKEVTESSHGL